MNPDIKLKIHKFLKKYGKIIGIAICIWLAIILINKLLKMSNNKKEPSTTYKPHVSVMDQSSSSPKKVQRSVEEFIKEYVDYCNNGEFEKAYNMISDDCKEYVFRNLTEYEKYIQNKFNDKKIYSIQNYSNYKGKYIYSVKLYDDILASGLTNSAYMYQEEKIIASYNKKGEVVFSVGNFVEQEEILSVQENEYIKADIKRKIVKYGFEIYDVKLTNKTENIILIKNNEIDNEILLNLSSELRKETTTNNIILEPEETKLISVGFEKFYDDKINSKSIIFNSIRVLNEYIENSPNEDNAIHKFSMELGLD